MMDYVIEGVLDGKQAERLKTIAPLTNLNLVKQLDDDDDDTNGDNDHSDDDVLMLYRYDDDVLMLYLYDDDDDNDSDSQHRWRNFVTCWTHFLSRNILISRCSNASSYKVSDSS